MSRDDDRTWAELVEAFNASPDADPREDTSDPWPAAENLDPDEPNEPEAFRDASVTLGSWPPGHDDRPPTPPEAPPGPPEPEVEHDHFVPPPPPPIPRGDLVSRLAWAGVIGSPLALILIAATNWSAPSWLMGLMVVAFVGGFGTLVARMRGHHPDDPDEGAVL